MDRKKIKLLIALHGWKIRCRKIHVYDDSGITAGFSEMYYAWLENANEDHYTYDMATTEGRNFYKNSIQGTRTKAINSMIDSWYEINKHTLEQ